MQNLQLDMILCLITKDYFQHQRLSRAIASMLSTIYGNADQLFFSF